MDEVCRRAASPKSPRRFVCLTFDGATRDLMTFGYPVLARHGVPFTVYVPTAFPDGLGEAWWLALEAVIARNDRIALVMDRKEQRFEIADADRKSPALRSSLNAGCARWRRKICRLRSTICASATPSIWRPCRATAS